MRTFEVEVSDNTANRIDDYCRQNMIGRREALTQLIGAALDTAGGSFNPLSRERHNIVEEEARPTIAEYDASTGLLVSSNTPAAPESIDTGVIQESLTGPSDDSDDPIPMRTDTVPPVSEVVIASPVDGKPLSRIPVTSGTDAAGTVNEPSAPDTIISPSGENSGTITPPNTSPMVEPSSGTSTPSSSSRATSNTPETPAV